MSDPFYRLLCELLEAGEAPASRFSTRSWKALDSLVDARVLGKRKSGGGLIVEVLDPAVLERFIRARFPLGDEEVAATPRAKAVLRLRNAKRATRTDREPILVRAFRELPCQRDGQRLDMTHLTQLTGAVCLVLGDGAVWEMTGSLAVVENLECFLHFEDMGVDADAALYASGRFSGRVLEWLASDSMSGCRLIHCGDYDPVGLCNYLRLKARAPERTGLFVPEGLEGKLKKFGRNELVHSSPAILSRLRSSEDPDVKRVVAMMDSTGLGLEQEALLGR